MKAYTRRYLATDVAARRLKFNTEIGKSSVQTNNQLTIKLSLDRHQQNSHQTDIEQYEIPQT